MLEVQMDLDEDQIVTLYSTNKLIFNTVHHD